VTVGAADVGVKNEMEEADEEQMTIRTTP